MARAVYKLEWIPQSTDAFIAILLLGVTTAAYRLLLFSGVKQLGSLQTVLLGIFETAVALVLSFVLLHDQLKTIQWIGVGVLLTSLLVIGPDELVHRGTTEQPIFNMAGIGFQQIAFTQAFANNKLDGVTAEELEMIRRMMEPRPLEPDQPIPPAVSPEAVERPSA